MVGKYKVIFFDAGGTLLKPHPSVGHIYQEVASRHGRHVSIDELNALFYKAWHNRDDKMVTDKPLTEKIEREWWHHLVEEVFSQLGGVENFEPFFDELYDRFARAESWKLFPETIEVLAQLKERGKRLFIVSNWDSRLHRICDGLDLMRYFEQVFASALVGAAKPSEKIFRTALEAAGVGPKDAVHVGDSFEDDVRGARRVGIEAVLIDRNPHDGRPARNLHEHVDTIHDLRELLV